MFSKLFGQKGPRLVPMGPEHHAYAIAIINETDDDDAAEADAQFREEGYEGMFVLVDGSRVLGLTGAHMADNSDDVAWLSWTYLSSESHGQGMGQFMLDGLLGQLNEHGVRKIFIETSDYAEDGEEIYADAMQFYRSLGAEEEMRVPDYHDAGEAKIVFGLVNPGVEPGEPLPMDPITGVRFTALGPAPESVRGYGLQWSIEGHGTVGLDQRIDEAQAKGARAVFVSLPSDVSDFAAPMLEAKGFAVQGRLTDFHTPGVDDVWWSRMLN